MILQASETKQDQETILQQCTTLKTHRKNLNKTEDITSDKDAKNILENRLEIARNRRPLIKQLGRVVQ